MKTIFSFLFMLTLFTSHSQAETNELPLAEESEILEESEPESPRYKIKDIKNYVLTLDPQNTCMDQYLKRRRQVIIQLSLTPLILPASFASGAVGGMVTGSFTYTVLYRWFGLVTSPNGGWDQLGYIIGGGVIGAAGASVYALAKGGMNIAELIDHNRLLKSLMELHQNEIGPVTEYLYSRFEKQNPGTTLSLSSFADSMIRLDQEGRLCDGSVKKKRSRIFPNSLKNKLTRSKDLYYFLNN